MFPFTTISLARSVRNVFIRERANETDWDDDGGVDDSNKMVISGDEWCDEWCNDVETNSSRVQYEIDRCQ